MARAVLALWCTAISSASAGLIGLGDPSYSARDLAGPIVARAPPAPKFSGEKGSESLAVLGLNGTGAVVSSTPPISYTEDAIDPGCNAALRVADDGSAV